MRPLFALFALLLAYGLIAAIPYGEPLKPQTTQMLNIPFVVASPPNPKGMAGWVTTQTVASIGWTYQWNTMYPRNCAPYPVGECISSPYELVNDVRSSPSHILESWNCPLGAPVYPPPDAVACLAQYAQERRGSYWLWLNEPDWPYPPNSDDISPAIAAQYWQAIKPAILQADPTARIIVGNVLQLAWLDQFISLVGLDGITGFGVHAYGSIAGGACNRSDDACLLTAFGLRLAEQRAWANQYPSKELWLTEWNIVPDNFDESQILRTMPLMCGMIRSNGFTRYAYFTGGNWPPSLSASLANPDGVLANSYAAC